MKVREKVKLYFNQMIDETHCDSCLWNFFLCKFFFFSLT